MTKCILTAALTMVGLGLTASDAQAGRRCCRCNVAPACCNAAPTCCGAMTADPATPAAPAPPATAQSNGNGYQSFSYEPGTATTNAAYVAPANDGYRSNNSAFYDSVRGDKKLRAFYR